MPDPVKTIGFIGLGIMGAPMARHLLQAGFDVIVHNRTREKEEPLAQAGAERAPCPADAAARSDVSITIVSDTPDVEAVVLGPDGVLEGARPGHITVDMSTISPTATRRIAQEAEAKGVDTLDAPVSGGDTGARAGTLSIMVGGRPEVFGRVRPAFEAMGERITHVGGHGAGQGTKLCNQVAGAINILATCEALLLAESSGLDAERVIEALSGGAAGSWMLSNLGPRMIDRDFAPGFFVRLQQKDLRLVLEAGRELGIGLPGTALVHQLFSVAEGAAPEEGTQALYKVIERLQAGRSD